MKNPVNLVNPWLVKKTSPLSPIFRAKRGCATKVFQGLNQAQGDGDTGHGNSYDAHQLDQNIQARA